MNVTTAALLYYVKHHQDCTLVPICMIELWFVNPTYFC